MEIRNGINCILDWISYNIVLPIFDNYIKRHERKNSGLDDSIKYTIRAAVICQNRMNLIPQSSFIHCQLSTKQKRRLHWLVQLLRKRGREEDLVLAKSIESRGI